jgi:hypothetical protein
MSALQPSRELLDSENEYIHRVRFHWVTKIIGVCPYIR